MPNKEPKDKSYFFLKCDSWVSTYSLTANFKKGSNCKKIKKAASKETA